MMHMPWVVAVLMLFFILVGGAAFAAVRVMASLTARRDHPGRPRR